MSFDRALAMLARLELPEADRVWLQDAAALPEALEGIRCAVVAIVDQYARDRLSAADWRAYSAVRETLPRAAPFSHVPCITFPFVVATFAHLTAPALSLPHAMRRTASEAIAERLPKLPIFGSLFAACNGSIIRFAELATVRKTFFEKGEVILVDPSSHGLTFRYEALPVAALMPIFEGYNEGLFQVFGLDGRRATTIISSSVAEMALKWS